MTKQGVRLDIEKVSLFGVYVGGGWGLEISGDGEKYLAKHSPTCS